MALAGVATVMTIFINNDDVQFALVRTTHMSIVDAAEVSSAHARQVAGTASPTTSEVIQARRSC